MSEQFPGGADPIESESYNPYGLEQDALLEAEQNSVPDGYDVRNTPEAEQMKEQARQMGRQ